MKTTKITLLAFLIGASVVSVKAQGLQSAISKIENERFEEAGAELKALTTKEPNNGEYWFYYGENYFKRAALDNFPAADVDSAQKMYQKGFEVNATHALPYIGLGKIFLLQGNEKDANANFFKAATFISKAPNATHSIRLAEAYLANAKYRNPDEAIKHLTPLLKTDGKNPEVHIVMGDALFFKNTGNAGEAVKSYDKAFELDKKSCRAILKKGKIYKMARNEKLGLQYFQEAIKIDSTFAPAYREMAELYHEFGKDASALVNMQKYVQYNPSDGAKKRLMEFMFVMRMYKEVIPIIAELQSKGMKSFYLYRYLGWAYYEAGEKFDKDAYKKGMEAMNNFFDAAGADFKYLPNDYKYKGLLISKAFKDSIPMLEKAVAELRKAVDIDKEKNCDLYTDIGGLYMKMKKFAEAIEAFKMKATCASGMNGQDYYGLGRAYFLNNDLINADTTFGWLIKTAPTNPVGYLWRAKVNSSMDPKTEKGLAKQWYEKYFEMIKPEERGAPGNKANVLEALDYLNFYWYKQKDKATLQKYVDELKALDPGSKKINEYEKYLKGPGK